MSLYRFNKENTTTEHLNSADKEKIDYFKTIRKIADFCAEKPLDDIKALYEQFLFETDSTIKENEFKKRIEKEIAKKTQREFTAFLESNVYIFLKDQDYINAVYNDYCNNCNYVFPFITFSSKYNNFCKSL
jgi:2-phosphoglycerate kinase